MFASMRAGALAALLCAHIALGQAPNTIARKYPNDRTSSMNGTWVIIPIDTAAVQKVTQPYLLLPVPANDRTLFPQGFPAGKHPVVVSSGYMNDIRMSALEIDTLLGASIYVPFTDRLRDGKTPFTYPARNYIGGVNGMDLSGLVPSLVGTLEGTTIFVATFDPNNQAYKDLGGGVFSQGVKKVILPNPVSGPGVKPAAFDSMFTTTTQSKYTEHTFHALINQPTILNNGFCQRNMYYFNETTTNPIMRNAEVTLYGPLAGNAPASLAGNYKNNGGYSATAQTLGFNAQTCMKASAQFDPAAKV